MEKDRLDNLVVGRGLASSRERARSLILEGRVMVGGQRCDKPGTRVNIDAEISCRGSDLPYVSRGGLKLQGAINRFAIDFTGKTVLDIGASTGGFTDCALQHGARSVVALDVGYGQLAWKLRSDPRVRIIERTNIRYFTREQLGETVDIITCDVSFISLLLVLPVLPSLLNAEGEAVLLIKPQFEAGKERVGKKGVVKDPLVHQEVISRVMEAASGQGFQVKDLWFSPLKGPEGNIEYLLYLSRKPQASSGLPDIETVVNRAQAELG